MSFTTVVFLFFFFPFFCGVYFLLRRFPKRNTLLSDYFVLSMSFLFYVLNLYAVGAGWKTGVALGVVCVMTALVGKILARLKNKTKSKLLFFVAVAFLPLFIFKYLNFILATINAVFHSSLSAGTLIAPLGISFITFSVVSYLVDVYRGEDPGSLRSVGLYLLFFPKILSGPIITWKEFHAKWNARQESIDLAEQGVRRIIVGMAKKVIIADSLGATIALINSNIPQGVDSPTILLLGFCMMFQIYLDFSGYSDFALGISNLLGVQWKENFSYPYLSTSVTEFWRRWHISLGSWFREYLYIPLGGSRKGNVYFHLFIVFFATGIWHGAHWNMVAWGILNGLAVIVERKWKKQRDKLPRFFAWLMTMVFVYFSWMLFMAPSLGDAWGSFRLLFHSPYAAEEINFQWPFFLTSRTLFFLIIAMIGSFLPMQWRERICRCWRRAGGSSLRYWAEAIVLLTLFVVSVLFMINASYRPFLYFQF